VVNIAVPSIGRDLDISGASLPWVINAYVLTFGGLLLLAGRATDLFGQRRMFTVGMLLFAVASLVGGLSATAAMLIAARAVQGLGSAVLREIGGAFGVGALAPLAAGQTDSFGENAASRAEALNDGLQAGVIGAAIFVFAALLVAVALLPRERGASMTPTQHAPSPRGQGLTAVEPTPLNADER
jgi:MFS family permease